MDTKTPQQWPHIHRSSKFGWENPAALEEYLLQSENVWGDAMAAGVEKKVVWQNAGQGRTTCSIAYLHGFSASHRELAPIPERLANRLQANLFLTRLNGHGLSGTQLAAASLADWQTDAWEALAVGRSIGRQVVLMGMSTGAALALWLAAAAPTQVAALILISPNVGLRRYPARLLMHSWGRRLLWPLAHWQRSWQPVNARHGRYWTTRYPIKALMPMGALIETVRHIDPAAIAAPVLMLLSRDDRIIDVNAAEHLFSELENSQNCLIEVAAGEDPEHHIPGGDIIAPAGNEVIIGECLNFLEGCDLNRGGVSE